MDSPHEILRCLVGNDCRQVQLALYGRLPQHPSGQNRLESSEATWTPRCQQRKGEAYQVHITPEGIDLWHGMFNTDEESFIPDDNVTALTRTRSPFGVGIWPFASSQLLSPTLIAHFAKPTLRLMRNEIWARHGYIFTAPDLQQYFTAQPWYTPGNSNDAIQLSDIEQLNVDLIKAMENRPDND